MASSAAQLQTGFKVTLWDGLTPIFGTGSKVYIRSVVEASDTNNIYNHKENQWVVTNWDPSDAAGVILGGDGLAADPTQVANVATDGTTPDTHIKYPYFYRCVNSTTGEVRIFHESLLLNITGVNTVLGNETFTEF